MPSTPVGPKPQWAGPVRREPSTNEHEAAARPPFTALHSAAHAGDAALCASLLDAGADLDALDANRASPLHYAAGGGHLAVVRLLVARGADISLCRTYGDDTPIVAAVRGNHLSVVKLLAALPRARADLGEALLFAVRDDAEPLVQALIAAGADVNHVSPRGFSPLGLAKKRRKAAIASLLKKAGATDATVPATRRTVPVVEPSAEDATVSPSLPLSEAAAPWVLQLAATTAPKRRQAAKKLEALADPGAEDALLAAFGKELVHVTAWETQRDLARALATCGGARTVAYLRLVEPGLVRASVVVRTAVREAIDGSVARSSAGQEPSSPTP